MTLRSKIYDDIYFSKQSGVEESLYTFIEANQLSQRFKEINEYPFTIGELGFGTGLNFLLTVQSFLENAPSHSILHYFSVEKHPLPLAEIDVALKQFTRLDNLRLKLISILGESSWLLQGFHTLFFDRRVRLTILTGDVLDRLQELAGGKFDAWFADGFAPVKNPDMWTLPVFQELARLSKTGTTISSFSSAGEVRRHLTQVGFSIQKRAGYGNKREMIIGRFQGAEFETEASRSGVDRKAIIVGGGISGLSVAESLLKRGWQVELNERHNVLASEASGNATAMFLPYLTADKTVISDLTFRGSETFISALPVLKADHLLHRTGVIQRIGNLKDNTNDSENQNSSISLVSGKEQDQESKTQEREKRISRSMQANGLPRSFFRKIAIHHYFMRKAGWTEPAKLCAYLEGFLKKNHGDRFTVNTNRNIDFKNLPTADALIIAAGTELQNFTVSNFIPIVSVRGQVFECKQGQAIEYLKQSAISKVSKCKFKTLRPILYENYIIPKSSGWVFGATFEPGSTQTDRSIKSDQWLINQTAQQFPEIGEAMRKSNFQPVDGRVAFRSQTKDYIPVVGPLPNYEESIKKLRLNRSADIVLQDRIFVNGGFGSRGVMCSFLSAEILAAHINNEVFPIENRLVNELLPNRFVYRASKRQQ